MGFANSQLRRHLGAQRRLGRVAFKSARGSSAIRYAHLVLVLGGLVPGPLRGRDFRRTVGHTSNKAE